MGQALVLVFHPNLNDGSRINRRLAEVARSTDGVEVRDEYALYPDGRIDVGAEQRACEHSRAIVWQCPMYWYSTPPLLKQWEDEVLAHGWAYGSSGHALEGKSLMLAISAGATQSDYEEDGRFATTFHELLSPQRTTARRVGMAWMNPFVITGAMGMTDEQLDDRAEEYARILHELPHIA